MFLSGIHQVALLTHIDKISPDTEKDISTVYSSIHLKQLVGGKQQHTVLSLCVSITLTAVCFIDR